MQRHNRGSNKQLKHPWLRQQYQRGHCITWHCCYAGRHAGQRLCDMDLRFTQCKGMTVSSRGEATFDSCSLTAEVILGGGLLKLRWLRSLVFTTVSMRSLPPCRFLLWDLLLERSDLLLWVWHKRNKNSGRLVTRLVLQRCSEHSWQSACHTYLAWVTGTICVRA